MEQKGDTPDQGMETGIAEIDLDRAAVKMIWMGVDAYWRSGYLSTASAREGIDLHQTKETGQGLIRLDIELGYVSEDEDGEAYEDDELVFSGSIRVSESHDSDTKLVEGLKDVYIEQMIEAKKLAGKGDAEIAVDDELKEAMLETYSAWAVNEYIFGMFEEDGLEVMRSYILRDRDGNNVWSSDKMRSDEEDDEDVPEELEDLDFVLSHSIDKHDYFLIQSALVNLLRIPPRKLRPIL